MAFSKPTPKRTLHSTPGELYRDLTRRPGSTLSLWAHQSELLKTYVNHANHSDIALELPTGTGKTLIGLLIAEWNRRRDNKRILYACPTQQLAQQVHAAAQQEGIDSVLLVGSHRDWVAKSKRKYESADSICITTYSSIFNSSPKLVDCSVIILDDAHAGEQYVGEAYSVTLSRVENRSSYDTLLEVFQPALDDIFVERLKFSDPDPNIRGEVRLVLPLRQPGMVGELHTALSQLPEPHSFRFAMIHEELKSCLAYISYSEIVVRPYIPPTYNNQLFSKARQRVYLSATLGEGGELERSFGRTHILRVEQPDANTDPRTGRRFFVFPEFVDDADADDLTRAIISEAGKALVLSQRTDVAMADAKKFTSNGWSILGIDDVSTSMEPFTTADNTICALAARYDGLDLPGDICRLIVFDGTPDQLSLQERFLRRNAQAGVALESRIRTRIVQGTGRCTRGPKDTAIVLIRGDLSAFLQRPETISAFTPELQAEIRFGAENSQDGSSDDMLENVRAFLTQDTDDTWRSDAEPTIVEYRHQAIQDPPEGSEQLSNCATEEVEAWISASTNSWENAAKHAHEVCRILGDGGSATRQYQAFWKYLEAAWVDMLAEEGNDPSLKATALQRLAEAEKTAGGGSWIHQMAPFPEQDSPKSSRVDDIAASKIASLLRDNAKENSTIGKLERMVTDLNQKSAPTFEAALSILGCMLGAISSKPTPHGRCDSTWCWDNELWIALEAKSEHNEAGTISLKDIRQSNGQLTLLRSDRKLDWIPHCSATVIISPRSGVHSDGIAIADRHLFLTKPATVREIADDTLRAWKRLLSQKDGRNETDVQELIVKTFRSFDILPYDILRRLTMNPVGPASPIETAGNMKQ